jgi:hypothetical protein
LALPESATLVMLGTGVVPGLLPIEKPILDGGKVKFALAAF